MSEPTARLHGGEADVPSRRWTRDDVTVVLCTRDRPEMLAHALEALKTALGPGADILVVDSGSRSAATADTAAAAGVRFVRSDVPGLSIARNLGLASTEREIVVYTDDDCAVEPGFLEPLIHPFIFPVVGAVTGSLRDASASGSPLPAPSEEHLHRTTEGLDAGHGALMAFRRAALIEVGAFDPVLGAGRRFGGAEDMDAFCRVLHSGREIVRVPASVVTHLYTRSDDDYVQLNRNYGLGIGAMCAKWLRTSPRSGIALTALIARRGVSRYVRRLRNKRTRRGQSVYLRSIVGGLREAYGIPRAGGVFVDVQPPQPVVLVSTDGAAA
ncbi:glycosyltransferase family 2 protein [Herbiconiux daphne]|uniref:Glycosyltransferase family 2 protein n=1 Tax=Herbiconiux daphne TaxID=2970914 RepID=A0ABT2H6M2_9MICO|nr:glycosyltransferase family A protein [Herbiconiux daphne]MCS5735601.1 glycosyltransferase family 2 protein [Herbiconiux daphne]